MSDIFISYSRDDWTRVKPLAEALQNSCGWSVWWDVRIPSGKSFDEVIEAALDQTRCVLVVWSQSSINSHWVKTEANEGLSRKILVPVNIDTIKLPLAFKRLQTLDISAWQGDTQSEVFARLRADIAGVLGELVSNSDANTKLRVESSFLNPITKGPAQEKSYLKPEMVRIQGGRFMIGSQKTEKNRGNNESRHEVAVKDFFIGRYPVTFAEYDRYCQDTGCDKSNDHNWGRYNRPVIDISWFDAFNYAKWLSGKTGKHFRLPTEAKWEYAARAGTQTVYGWGDQFKVGMANCNHSDGKTTPVCSFPANPWGLFDMFGNVLEWTGSVYRDEYDGSETRNANIGDTKSPRVLRGGSWYGNPLFLRSASRYGYYPDYRDNTIGFRLVQD